MHLKLAPPPQLCTCMRWAWSLSPAFTTCLHGESDQAWSSSLTTRASRAIYERPWLMPAFSAYPAPLANYSTKLFIRTSGHTGKLHLLVSLRVRSSHVTESWSVCSRSDGSCPGLIHASFPSLGTLNQKHKKPESYYHYMEESPQPRNNCLSALHEG